jgi:hypothetical protein
MWTLLREAIVFYMRPFDETEDVPAEVHLARHKAAYEAANEKMQRYAELAETWFGHKLCKPNLHSLRCPLPAQLAVRGHTSFYMEFWVEMLVQWAKHMTKFRTTGCPEKLIVGTILMRLALDRLLSSSALPLMTVSQWLDSVAGVAREDTYQGRQLDDGEEDGTGFMGAGTRVGKLQEQECKTAMETHFKLFPDDDWGMQLVNKGGMLVYTQAHNGGADVIHSQAYGRSRSRVSHNIRVRYEEGAEGVEALYVGVVRYFLLARPCTADGHIPDKDRKLRFAIMDLYDARDTHAKIGNIMVAKGVGGIPTHKAFPVLLSSIDTKLVRCQAPGGQGSTVRDVMFIPYHHTPSGLV